MSSILTTHLVAGSFSGHFTFIAESIGTLCCYRNFFRRLSQLWSTTTPSGLPGPDLSSGSNSSVERSTTHLHARHFSPSTSPTPRYVRVRGPTFGDNAPLVALPAANLSPITLLLYFGVGKYHSFPFFSPTISSRAFLSPESPPFCVFQHSTTH